MTSSIAGVPEAIPLTDIETVFFVSNLNVAGEFVHVVPAEI